MYPIAMNHTARVLPPSILTGSIGWIAGLGQAGSALIPFMTGAIAEKHGIKSLHPLYVIPSSPVSSGLTHDLTQISGHDGTYVLPLLVGASREVCES